MGAGVGKGIGENMFNAAEDDIIIFYKLLQSWINIMYASIIFYFFALETEMNIIKKRIFPPQYL